VARRSTGAGRDDGLNVTSSGNRVIGLGVRGYVNGIAVRGGSGNRFVGVTATGNANAILVGGTVSGSVKWRSRCQRRRVRHI
jgi:hypothetical protein